MDVGFNVTSLGNFSGTVTINFEADGEATVIPLTEPITVNVTPSTPGTFTRRFELFQSTPVRVTFTAQSGAITHDTVITLNPN
jgi:hypothetical protein